MKFFTAFATTAISFAALTPNLATAQDKIGTTVIDGRKVDLFADQTWRYTQAAESDNECTSITKTLSFCGEHLGWEILPTAPAGITAMLRFDERVYAMYLDESIGTAQGLSHKSMRAVAVQGVSMATGIPAHDIPVLDLETSPSEFGSAEIISYAATVDGIDFVYRNTVILQENHVTQIVTYTFGTEISDTHRQQHAEFVAATRLD